MPVIRREAGYHFLRVTLAILACATEHCTPCACISQVLSCPRLSYFFIHSSAVRRGAPATAIPAQRRSRVVAGMKWAASVLAANPKPAAATKLRVATSGEATNCGIATGDSILSEQLLSMIKKLVKEVDELKQSVRTLQGARYPTSSTHLDGMFLLSASRRRGSLHVNFQDTFTYVDFDSGSPNSQPPRNARRASNRVFPQRQVGNGATQDQSTRETYMPQQTNRDVEQIVCKWHIRVLGSAK